MNKNLLKLTTMALLLISSVVFATNEASKPPVSKVSTESSAFEQRVKKEDLVANNSDFIALFQPNYILPYYYTTAPDQQVYAGDTPRNQSVKHQELEYQISFKVPVVKNMFDSGITSSIAYTQLSMWQIYNKTPFFRETNYMVDGILSKVFSPHWFGNAAAVHQSNGRGGMMERSWNRTYVELIYSGSNWMLSAKPWYAIFQHGSITQHNPDIMHYMGNGRLLAAYKLDNGLEFSLMTRNNMQSKFSRGAEEFDVSYPLSDHYRVYTRFFSGYGQTLIEYNHYTNAFGIGIALNDWI